MRIEKVEGNRKIRVLVTQDDLLEMNINISTLTPDSPELHSFLFRVMEYVKRETGFSAKNGQVMVEASPHEGGVALTVTKIATKKPIRKSDIKSIKVKKKIYPHRVYRFPSFDSLYRYFKIIDDATAAGMRLYLYRDMYFAVAATGDWRINEFTDRLPQTGIGERFLTEHAKLVADGKKLMNMIDGIKNLD